jgi:glucose/arabinose dehydrogenase
MLSNENSVFVPASKNHFKIMNTFLSNIQRAFQPGFALAIVLGAQLLNPISSEATPTIWSGPHVTFTRADGVDGTQAANQDRITPNVWIARSGIQGIYNAKTETGFTHGISPADTEWANGSIANYSTLSYTDWNSWANGINPGPPSTVGVDAVVHLISEDIYIEVKFLSWSDGHTGSGGFSYERSTATAAPNSPPSVSITSPTNGAAFTTPASVTIAADANDADGTVTNVEFFDGATSLGAKTVSPFSITANLSAGTHQLKAIATDDDSDSTTSATVTVSVNNTTISNPIVERIPKGDLTIELQAVADGMASPLGMTVPDDGSGRMFVYDQAGQIWLVTANGRAITPMLDVRTRLNPSAKYDYDERGLLGLAAHPNFAEHPYIYTYTSETNFGAADFPAAMTNGVPPNCQSVIAEWRVDPANTNRIDPTSRREILRIDKPQSNHNGGTMRFGPDGFLYFTIGDGGNANDVGNGHIPGGNAQSTMQILGKVHRIDVDGNNSANGKYGIPASNPFNGTNGLREIFAYGLRNPFSFSFDKLTGQLYLGDVGQNKVEEINIITNGGNYGWNVREGTFWFDSVSGNVVSGPARDVPPNLTEPIAVYDHDDGLAIIGGFVYRGSKIPELQGRYVFADWGSFNTPSGRLFYLDANNNIKEFHIGLDDRSLGYWVKGFGEGPDGELYVFGSKVVGLAGNTGKMFKILPAPDAVNFTSASGVGTNFSQIWRGGMGPFALQKKPAIGDPTWMNVAFSTNTNATVSLDGGAGFFRVTDTSRQPAIPLSISLSGAAEVPPTGSAATGFGLLSLEGNTLTFNIRYSGLSGPAIAAHIHGAAKTSVSTGVQIDLAPFNGGAFGSSGSISGMVIVSDAQKAMILAGQTYVNFHTANNPGGEIRGQIAPVLMQISLKDSNEHPALNTGGNGLGELALVGNQLTFNITYRGLSGSAIAAHIHGPASMSQDASVLVDLAPYNGGAFGSSGTLSGTVTLTPSQLASVIDGSTYVNFHTTAHAGGEIRGQILPQATAVPFTAPLTGLSEQPAITNSANGSAFFSLEGNALTFSINYGNLSSAATAAAIYGSASSSQTGAIQIDLAPFNGGAFGAKGTFAGTAILTPEQREMILGGLTYLNISTTANPSGEIRGQIAPVLMRAYLSGAEERPTPVLSNGSALGTFALVLNQLSFDVSYLNLTTTASDAHIHGRARVTQTAGILTDLGAFNGGAWNTSGTLVGTITLTASQLANVVDQLSYIDIHSTTFTNGEVRGQILR